MPNTMGKSKVPQLLNPVMLLFLFVQLAVIIVWGARLDTRTAHIEATNADQSRRIDDVEARSSQRQQRLQTIQDQQITNSQAIQELLERIKHLQSRIEDTPAPPH